MIVFPCVSVVDSAMLNLDITVIFREVYSRMKLCLFQYHKEEVTYFLFVETPRKFMNLLF
jgi:hypothetical protein